MFRINRSVSAYYARASRALTPSSGAPSKPVDPSPSEAATATDEQGTDVIEIEDDVVVGSKRKLKSAVWEDFDKICVNGKWKARCKWCTKQ